MVDIGPMVDKLIELMEVEGLTLSEMQDVSCELEARLDMLQKEVG